MICTHCKGNGFLRLSFEGEECTKQCWVCNSQGEVEDTKHFFQEWKNGESGRSFYYGPLLDPSGFKGYRINKQLSKK